MNRGQQKDPKKQTVVVTPKMISDLVNLTVTSGWGNTPYSKRQVYGAVENVPVEICTGGCPFFEKCADDLANSHGQPGACCSSKGSDDHGRKGTPACYEYVFSSLTRH